MEALERQGGAVGELRRAAACRAGAADPHVDADVDADPGAARDASHASSTIHPTSARPATTSYDDAAVGSVLPANRRSRSHPITTERDAGPEHAATTASHQLLH